MEHLEYWIVIALLIGIIILQIIERKDLYSRIMAKDLQEYKLNITNRHVPNGIRKKISDEMKRKNSPE